MIELLAQSEFTWSKWLETQSPLWVIYSLMICGLIALGRLGLKYLPTIAEKHIAMLETATQSLSQSAEAIKSVHQDVVVNRGVVVGTRENMSEAARPFCRALVAMAPAESKDQVREHLSEVQHILDRD